MYSLYIFFFPKQQQGAVKYPSHPNTQHVGVTDKGFLVWFSDSTAYQYPMTISFLDQNVTNFD